MSARKCNAVACRVFRTSGVALSDKLFDLATHFASTVDRRQLTSIFHSSDSGNDTIVVWFQKELL